MVILIIKIFNIAPRRNRGAAWREKITPIMQDGRNGMQQASVAVQPKLCQGGEDVNGRSDIVRFIGNEEAEQPISVSVAVAFFHNGIVL